MCVYIYILYLIYLFIIRNDVICLNLASWRLVLHWSRWLSSASFTIPAWVAASASYFKHWICSFWGPKWGAFNGIQSFFWLDGVTNQIGHSPKFGCAGSVPRSALYQKPVSLKIPALDETRAKWERDRSYQASKYGGSLVRPRPPVVSSIFDGQQEVSFAKGEVLFKAIMWRIIWSLSLSHFISSPFPQYHPVPGKGRSYQTDAPAPASQRRTSSLCCGDAGEPSAPLSWHCFTGVCAFLWRTHPKHVSLRMRKSIFGQHDGIWEFQIWRQLHLSCLAISNWVKIWGFEALRTRGFGSFFSVGNHPIGELHSRLDTVWNSLGPQNPVWRGLIDISQSLSLSQASSATTSNRTSAKVKWPCNLRRKRKKHRRKREKLRGTRECCCVEETNVTRCEGATNVRMHCSGWYQKKADTHMNQKYGFHTSVWFHEVNSTWPS